MDDETTTTTTMYFSAMSPVEPVARTTSKYEQSLASTLSAVEELVEQGHINAHAHVVISNCLKTAFEAANSDRSSDLLSTAILFVVQVPWLMDLFRPAPQGRPPMVDVLDENFMKSLFLKRVAYDATVGDRTDGGIDSQWLAQVLGFYMPSVERARSTAGESAVDNFCVAYTDRLRGAMMQLLRATSDEALAPVRSALVTYVVHHQEMPPLLHVCPHLFRPDWTSVPKVWSITQVHAEFATSYATLMRMGDLSEGDDGDTPENGAAAQVCLVATDAKFVHTLLYNAPGLVDWVFENSRNLLAADFRGASCVGRQLTQAHPHRFWLPCVRNPRRSDGSGGGALTVCAEVVPTTDPTNPQTTFVSV